MNEWTIDEELTIEQTRLGELRRILEHESALIVEHRFFKGGRAPQRFVCDDPDALTEYVRVNTRPGDALYFWRFEECCTDSNTVAKGKIPDAEGRIPIGGAY